MMIFFHKHVYFITAYFCLFRSIFFNFEPIKFFVYFQKTYLSGSSCLLSNGSAICMLKILQKICVLCFFTMLIRATSICHRREMFTQPYWKLAKLNSYIPGFEPTRVSGYEFTFPTVSNFAYVTMQLIWCNGNRSPTQLCWNPHGFKWYALVEICLKQMKLSHNKSIW